MMGGDRRQQYPDEAPYVRHLLPPARQSPAGQQYYDPAAPQPGIPLQALQGWPMGGGGSGWWPMGAHAGLLMDWSQPPAHSSPANAGGVWMGGGSAMALAPQDAAASASGVAGVKKKTGPKPNLDFEKKLYEALQEVPSLFRSDWTIQRASFADVKEIAREVRGQFGEDDRVQKLSFSDSWVTDFLTKHGLRKAKGGPRKPNFKREMANEKIAEVRHSLLEVGFPTNVVESSVRPLLRYIESRQQRIEKRNSKLAAACAG
eukprot:CAMPEP_0174951540 /NCGR_PEP_ID=MMETSP1355-20121228/94905_1 /TAXON_ID=464990 /ORGANISM="Hemiselmis tepida, Strain CCMP443" /LENGTH=259 /DNA_ID=CAMNT_0016199203 /DNA_START=906 /DNA_END=1681 /DNA_ORIENTATION=-